MDATRINMKNKLRLFGHLLDSESDDPVELEEVTLVADPDLLDEIATLILDAAVDLRRSPEGFNHRQLSLRVGGIISRDIIIANPSLVAEEPQGA